ncbi:MAG: hypothetical protein WEB53_12120 [Akkermansiaceae bacterium]
MTPHTQISGFACMVIAWCLLTLPGICQTTSRMSTRFLARGEQSLLEVSIVAGDPESLPVIAPIKNVVIQPAGTGPRSKMLPGRKFEHVFEYIVASYEIGGYTIPPIEVTVGGVKTLTEPLDFKVFNPDDLQWSEVDVDGATLRYASSFHTMNPSPYEGETSHTEIKVFVPQDLEVEDWGIPELQRDGLTAWRFQPSDMRSRVNLLGQPYIAVAYPSSITATRTGKIAIGPAKVRLTTLLTIMNPFPTREFKYIFLDVPKLEFDSKPLPQGAPPGFDNAVGDFRISASTSATEVKEGEPISVDLFVSGTGNLDTLRPPKLSDETGWKVYEPTADQRGDERRQVSGSLIFHQFMRPLELKPAVPPFQLVYFDPKDEIYKISTSEPIPLKMVPGAAVSAMVDATVQALPIPLERMTDILGIMKTAQLTLPAAPATPGWTGHALATLVALGLIIKALWMRFAHRLRKDPAREARIKALREIEKSKPAADVDFLKATGNYIESWLGENQTPEIQAILAERDAVCFRAEKPQSVLDQKHRNSILKTLHKAAAACLLAFLLGFAATPARAADVSAQALEAYEAAKFDDAIKLWLGAGDYQSLSADTLYNIGNACYRSSSPGHAALFYRRALDRNPNHEESRQNLRFIERKYGAITVQRPEYQYALTKLPLAGWQAMLWGGLWFCALGMLVFPATRSDARIRILAISALVIGPLIACVGLLGWRYFPNDSEFAPIERQAVIIAENTVLHADAARTSPEVIDAPPGSLCEIIRESGSWVYVAFATRTRGWVPIQSIEKIQPDQPPTLPKFRKPKADGKTA